MCCLYCGKEIGAFRLLRDSEFCSVQHRKMYGERLSKSLHDIAAPEPPPAPIAAFRDERLQVVAHRRGPVLIVANAQHELVGLQNLGPEFQIAVDRIFERKAIRFSPSDKMLLPLTEL